MPPDARSQPPRCCGWVEVIALIIVSTAFASWHSHGDYDCAEALEQLIYRPDRGTLAACSPGDLATCGAGRGCVTSWYRAKLKLHDGVTAKFRSDRYSLESSSHRVSC